MPFVHAPRRANNVIRAVAVSQSTTGFNISPVVALYRSICHVCPEEARQRRLQLWWEKLHWSELIEQQQERLEEAEMQREIERRRGFWFG